MIAHGGNNRALRSLPSPPHLRHSSCRWRAAVVAPQPLHCHTHILSLRKGSFGRENARVRRPTVARSNSAAEQSQPSQSPASDPFITAGVRLQKLLDDVNWDSGEEVRQELLALPIGSRLTFFTNLSCIVLTVSIILNVVTSEDMFGGMSLSHYSMVHALHGAGYALPLLATSLLGRSSKVHSMFPVLEALHDVEEKVMEPLVKDLDAPQLLIVCLTTTLPFLMLMLPAMHGSLLLLGQMLQADLLSPAGVQIPRWATRELAVLVPAMSSSYFAAYLVARQLGVKRGQYQALQSAVTHSDRYFRLTESMALQSVDSGQQSRQASEAFKIVSVVWVLMRKKVSQLSFVLTALNVCYVAMIWHDTNDLSTPLTCALLSFGFEMLLCRKSLAAKEAARRRLRREVEGERE